MEKNLKSVKTIAVLLIVVLISVIAFAGLYLKKQGIWQNVLKEFNYGMELDGMRQLRFALDTSEEEKEVYIDKDGNIAGEVVKEDEHDHSETDDEEKNSSDASQENSEDDKSSENSKYAEEKKVDEETLSQYTKETRNIKANEDADINIENFEKSKKIIQKRLEKLSGYEYNIRLDAVTGEFIVEFPNDDNLELAESLITTIGKFEIIDTQTGIILISSDHVKKASTMANQTEKGTQFYLQVEFDKQGAEILRDISTKYITTTNDEGEEDPKFVSIKFDGQDLLTTSFGQEVGTGFIQISLGNPTTDQAEFNSIRDRAEMMANIINEDIMPLEYKLSSDNYIKSSITKQTIMIAEIIFAVLVAAVSIFIIFKYKLKGLKAVISAVGYVALLVLVVKYTNVKITINSLIAFIGVIAINYVFILKLLKKSENSNTKTMYGKTMKEIYLTIVPVAIIAIIFTFMTGVIISSIGMMLFWGLCIQAIYSSLLVLALDII